MPPFANNEYDLSESDETLVIFGQRFDGKGLSTSNRRRFLKKLASVADKNRPPSSEVYKTIGSVNVYRKGGAFRAFCSIAEECPAYNVIYVFLVTEDHDYNVGYLRPDAKNKTQEFNSCEDIFEIENLLGKHTTYNAKDIRDMIS